MTVIEIARALLAARDERRTTVPPTEAEEGFGLDEAYRVAGMLDHHLRERGFRRVGWKVGFTNRKIWPRLGLEEPILAPVYDHTLRVAAPAAELSVGEFCAPRLEFEIVLGLESEAGGRRARDRRLSLSRLADHARRFGGRLRAPRRARRGLPRRSG